MSSLNTTPKRVVNFGPETVIFRYGGEELEMPPASERVFPPEIARAAIRDFGHLGLGAVEVDADEESRASARTAALERRRDWLVTTLERAYATVRNYEDLKMHVRRKDNHVDRVTTLLEETEALLEEEPAPKPKRGRPKKEAAQHATA